MDTDRNLIQILLALAEHKDLMEWIIENAETFGNVYDGKTKLLVVIK